MRLNNKLWTALRSKTIVGSVAIVLSLFYPVIALTDDIDIYKPSVDADHKPSIIIMLDTSSSMNAKAKAWQPSRLDRIKRPIVDFMRSASGVRVGLSTFNGRDVGGAVVYPAKDLNEDLCPDRSCSSVSISNYIVREDDDGYETVGSAGVNLTSAGASIGQRVANLGSAGYYADVNGQTVVETASGITEVEVLPFSLTESGATTSVGLHFPSVRMNDNWVLRYAYVRFEWAGQEWLNDLQGDGTAKLRLHLDSREDSPSFADEPGRRVTDRPKTTAYVDWNLKRPTSWNLDGDNNYTVSTPNFVDALAEARPSNDSIKPVTLLIEPAPDATVTPTNTVHLLGNHTRTGEEKTPRLVYGFYKDPYTPPSYLNARRFDVVNIPPGATITSARMEIQPRGRGDETDIANLVIAGEQSGDSKPFRNNSGNLSSRSKTTAQVNWSSEKWYPSWQQRKTSPDLSPIIQEIVNLPDWCSGNAITLMIDGTGERFSWMYRAGSHLVDSLHITYDPSSVDPANHCSALTGSNVLMYRAESDLIQGGSIINSASEEEFIAQTGHSYAIRFENIDLGPDDEITDARLQLTQTTSTTTNWYYTYTVDTDTGSLPLSTDETLDDRFASEQSLTSAQTAVSAGYRLESIDLDELIQAAIDDPEWVRGSAITIRVKKHWGSGVTAVFKTAQNLEGEGPTLHITRRVSGSKAEKLPLKTPRDELTEALNLLSPSGDTPLVDAFYESAAYLLGESVHHGTKRGEQQSYNAVHRLSHPDTYTGGSVVRPPGCYADTPGSTSCVTEFVSGSPVYSAPDSTECSANQIILVTDGAPTISNPGSAGMIRSLTDTTSCESSNASEECALELATWLANGANDGHAVKVSTIGFDFSSSFLDDLAAAGGGKSYSVASSGQVTEALRQIGEKALYDGGLIAAPMAPVNQYSRTAHRGDLYYGFFRPGTGIPLWAGNIKKYQMGKLDDGSVGLVDADGGPVIDPETGKINSGVRSLWSVDDDNADVEAGGAASQLNTNRTIYTHPDLSVSFNHGARALERFNVSNQNIGADKLGLSSADRDLAINWMLGEDVKDEDGDGVTDEARKSMGAAIHSTPAVLNYPSNGDDMVSVVFAGTQEGYLHAIDSKTGSELWGFLPSELYANVGAFYTEADSPNFRYGLDGGITTHFDDTNNNMIVDGDEQAFVTVGMRRGGGHYYTLNVTDPESPSLAWTIDNTRTGFENLGQSWSKPAVANIPINTSGTTKRVLIFGNGYHTINDLPERNTSISHTDKGAIYIVDADTGGLIHALDENDHSDMIWSIPSEITAVRPWLNDKSHVLLVGDVGGNLWRVDLGLNQDEDGNLQVASPTLSLIAQLADSSATDGDRRFFHPPEVGMMKGGDGQQFLGLTIGSGRRDLPTDTATQDRLYFINLHPSVARTTPLDHSGLTDATSELMQWGSASNGWWIDLSSTGEKMLSTPVLLDGRILATTFVPAFDSGTACEPNIGTGRLYVVDAFSALGLARTFPDGEGDSSQERYTDLDNGGIPPSVSVLISDEDPDKPVAMVGLEPVDGAKNSKSRWMTYWIDD
ncbi:MAG: PQQ-binding-like beta-propeller repeat protein [Granulosicoccus sp.]|nr:PQQ-binding-like beta-propeller repeat protein [Granulosicoccus sp.]